MNGSAENDAPDLVAWVMPREDARDLLRWLRHNRPLGMPDPLIGPDGFTRLAGNRVIPPGKYDEWEPWEDATWD